MKIQLTIIGLERMGTSFGLALKDHSEQIFRVGHDRNQKKIKSALDMGAIDKAAMDIKSAIVEADIIILATPVDEIRETFEVIAGDLKPGAVVMDTSVLKNAVSEWAKEFLPDDRYFISLQPTLNPNILFDKSKDQSITSADLFKNAQAIITTGRGVDSDVIKLAADLARYLGAYPYFADPYEIDGINSGIEILPGLISAAYIHTITSQPGWREGQKIAGENFLHLAEQAYSLPEREDLGVSQKNNRENLVRLINEMMVSLRDLRTSIESENWEELRSQHNIAREEMESWQRGRQKADWDQLSKNEEIPSSGDFLLRMIGFGKKKKIRPE